MKSTIDIIRGLLCLSNPDKSGGRCWNCVYKCEDPKIARMKILRDGNNCLKMADGTAKEKGKGAGNDRPVEGE